MRASAIALTVVMLGARALSADQAVNDARLTAFVRATMAYAELHRAVVRDLPPLEVTSDPDKMVAATEARRAALRRARAEAKQGDIITAEASPVLRERIRTALRTVGMTCAELMRLMADDSRGYRRAEVNGTFSWTTAAGMPGCILATLPPLPEMLQYRFVGPDLVLVDVEASLIADVLRDALVDNVN